MKKILAPLIIIFIVFLGSAAFITYNQASKKPITNSGKLQVVTTFAPMYIFTKNVTGELADVQNLLPTGIGPHDYALTPSDVIKIARAEVIVKHGRGIDDWLDGVMEATGQTNRRIIVASENIEPHTGSPGFSLDSGPTPPSPNIPLTKPDSGDPHIWLDPFLVIKEVENIRDGLMDADPKHRQEYARNAEQYILKLLSLDREIRAAFQNLSKRSFITFHPAFRYFAYEYELQEIGVIETVPGQEPSPTELARLADIVRQTNVDVIFSEPQFQSRVVETLSMDYNLRIARLDPLETGELRSDYYEEVMRNNTSTIVSALGTRTQ